MKISIGQIVYSKSGRDAGRKLVVVGIIDKDYVEVADGRLRKISNPKKKKIKHLKITETVLEKIEKRMNDKNKLSDAEINKVLKLF